MRIAALFLLSCFFGFSTFASEKIEIGEKLTLQSKIIGEERPIWVYVPEGLAENEPAYVIYVLDAEVHFHTVTGIVKSLVDYDQIPPAIVVGVETTNRPRDYLPAVDGEPKTDFQAFVLSKWPNSGQENFMKFLDEELFPFIEKKYATHPHRTLIGHSNGGTVALSAMFERPELFNNYMAISPNGWWSYEQTVANVKKLTQANRPKEKLFITVAGEGRRFYTGTLDLLSNLEANQPKNLEWKFTQYSEYTHMSGILPALSDGLEYLFNDLNFKVTPEIARYSGVDAVLGYYAELSKQYGFKVAIPVDVYVDFAEQQQNHGRYDAALQTLLKFTADYPDYSYAHMRLAQGYEKANQLNKAVESFKHALALATQQKREPNIIDALQDMVNRAEAKL